MCAILGTGLGTLGSGLTLGTGLGTFSVLFCTIGIGLGSGLGTLGTGTQSVYTKTLST